MSMDDYYMSFLGGVLLELLVVIALLLVGAWALYTVARRHQKPKGPQDPTQTSPISSLV